MNATRRLGTIALPLALAAAGLTLAACDRRDDGTVTADARRATQTAESGARDAARSAANGVERAADAVGDKAKDMAVTAEVKARLARDEQLSALDINVDTTSGRVVLRGSAPNTAARTRATELARAVDSVTAVDNELNVQPKAN